MHVGGPLWHPVAMARQEHKEPVVQKEAATSASYLQIMERTVTGLNGVHVPEKHEKEHDTRQCPSV